MKPHFTLRPLIASCITAGLIAAAHAVEAPADDAAPPAEAPAREATAAAEAENLKSKEEVEEKDNPAEPAAAFLGIASMQVPDMLAEHLGLKAGEGVVVRAVVPDGPAAKAGIAANDVIVRIAGEAVGSAADLSREIASRKPDEKVAIDLIRKGKASNVEVTLTRKPDAVAGVQDAPLDQLNLDGIPQDLADRIRGAVEGQLGDLGQLGQLGQLQLELNGAIPGDPAGPKQMDEAVREMRERMRKAMEGLQDPEAPAPDAAKGRVEIRQGATFRLMDGEGSVEIKSNDGTKEVTVRDKEQNVTWSGPWDTEQDKAAAPADIRRRVERLNFNPGFNGKGIELKIGPGGILPE